MSKKTRKTQRNLAVEQGVQRRIELRKAASPVDRDQMLALKEFVGKSIVENGFEKDFQFTRTWANQNSVEFDSLAKFFSDQRITDDWSVLMEGDPYALLGSTATRYCWMPMEEQQLEALLDWLDAKVGDVGCQHDHRLTKEWLSRHGLDVSTNVAALMSHGGHCDCEVVLNVDPEGIYPKQPGHGRVR